MPTFASQHVLALRPPGVATLRFSLFLGFLALGCSERQTPASLRATETPSAEPRQAAAKPAAPSPPTALDEAPTRAEERRTAVASDSHDAPRIYAKARFAWIQKAPRGSPGWIGYLSYGGSLPLRGGSVEAARAIGKGCATWYAVEPIGYVCAGDTATLDDDDPIVKALAADAPDVSSPWPYHYGESLGAPRYKRIPSVADQRRNEWDLDRHKEQIEKARSGGPVAKDLVGVD